MASQFLLIGGVNNSFSIFVKLVHEIQYLVVVKSM